jgi:hypothetical protein
MPRLFWHHRRGRCPSGDTRKNDVRIAPFVDHLKKRLILTHPFHPRFSEEFELVSYRRSWGRECVDCRDGDGELVTIPLQWTDATGFFDPFLEASGGRSYFRVSELMELVELIKRMEASEPEAEAQGGVK